MGGHRGWFFMAWMMAGLGLFIFFLELYFDLRTRSEGTSWPTRPLADHALPFVFLMLGGICTWLGRDLRAIATRLEELERRLPPPAAGG